LPYAELPGLMAELRQRNGIAFRALEFTILTAARTGEVLGAKWGEINLVDWVWIIPPDRMKAGREHRVPLANGAVEILEIMLTLRINDFVFPGERPGGGLGPRAMRNALRRLGRADLTVHGFRSTFADWVTERTNFPAEARELALAHTVGAKTEAA